MNSAGLLGEINAAIHRGEFQVANRLLGLLFAPERGAFADPARTLEIIERFLTIARSQRAHLAANLKDAERQSLFLQTPTYGAPTLRLQG